MNPISRLLQPKKALLEDQRVAASIVTQVLLEMRLMSIAGAPLKLLDEVAERMIRERGGEPYNKGYKPAWAGVPFPATVCMSVNEEVCHGIPGNRVLEKGDLVNYDVGVRYRSGCGDAALSVPVGVVSNRKLRTLRFAHHALYAGIAAVKAGAPVSAIGRAIDEVCAKYNMRSVKQFTGHHIGKEMHEKPHIQPYYIPENDTILLKEGAIICIEPHITPGDGRIGLAPDQWTHFTLDNQPVAMFEHMVLVTKEGCEILTNHITENDYVS